MNTKINIERRSRRGFGLVTVMVFLLFTSSTLAIIWNRSHNHYIASEFYIAGEANSLATLWAVATVKSEIERDLAVEGGMQLPLSISTSIKTQPVVQLVIEAASVASQSGGSEAGLLLDSALDQKFIAIKVTATCNDRSEGSLHTYRVTAESTLELIRAEALVVPSTR